MRFFEKRISSLRSPTCMCEVNNPFYLHKGYSRGGDSRFMRVSAGFWCLLKRHANSSGGWAGGREDYTPQERTSGGSIALDKRACEGTKRRNRRLNLSTLEAKREIDATRELAARCKPRACALLLLYPPPTPCLHHGVSFHVGCGTASVCTCVRRGGSPRIVDRQ